MEWSTCNSNNENGLLRANGPHRLYTAGRSFIHVRHPQIIESTKLITIGEVRIYGTSGIAQEKQLEKKDPTDLK